MAVDSKTKVAVCSRSFSKNQVLRGELLQRYASVTFNDAGLPLNGDSLVAFLDGHEKAIVALEAINESVLVRLPKLKVLSKYGVGLDTIDLAAMRALGKRLGWTGGVNRRSVSELALSFAIAMLRRVPAAHREVLDGTWRQHTGSNLSGRTVGIVGCGHIGKDFVELLTPFGCKILVNDILHFPEFYRQHRIEAVSLDDLLLRADVVSLHVPLNCDTRNLLDARRLALMKTSSILINTARGGLVDELALKSMLLNNCLAGAAFDVFSEEPPQDKELISLRNFLVTPHIGGSSQEAILAMGRAAIEGLDQQLLPEDGID